MTITSRIIFLFLSSGLFLVSIATGYVAQREYGIALDNIVSEASVRSKNRPELQFTFYRQYKPGLEAALDGFLEPGAVTSAAAYSSLGDKIASRGADGHMPSLPSVRADATITETALIALDANLEQAGTSFWSTLIAGDSSLYLSMPIFSPVNPAANNLTYSDFLMALTTDRTNESLVVIGFINLTIDRGILLNQASPAALRIFAVGLMLLLFFTVPVYLYIRNATGSITRLNGVAARFLSGELEKHPSIDIHGEYRDIAQLVKNTIYNRARSEEESDLEHKLLLLQAGERASQLSQTEEELSKATQEITATKEQLHKLANYDHLTSLPNRQLFSEQLDLLLRLCARDARSLAVLTLSIENYHRVNDSLGRSTGDALLKEVGSRLVGCLRSSDVQARNVDSQANLNVSRLSGDEFAIALGHLDSIDTAGVIAQRIVDQLIKPMRIEEHELVVIPKIGISIAPRNGMEAEELLKYSSVAMHNAKSASGGNFLYYKDEMEGSGVADIKMEAELRRAIERNELSLHYQPQVDTTDGSIVCAEAFLRWDHPEFGHVSPGHFIQLAEETGLIWELGDWVLEEVCRQLSEFESRAIKLPRVAINISPEQIQPAFVTRLGEVLRETGVPPSKLELGLSEAILVNQSDAVIKFLEQLRETGVYLSLENFGTSHAPLEYLSRYPLDEIKIDRSFIAGCDTKESSARLIKAIIAMSNSLGLPTVAEGVETEGECRFLTENGVIKMRGYLFSKPVTPIKLEELLAVPWHYMAQIQKMALIAELGASQNI